MINWNYIAVVLVIIIAFIAAFIALLHLKLGLCLIFLAAGGTIGGIIGHCYEKNLEDDDKV